MGNFQELCGEMIRSIERRYRIELTLGEKVSLKHCMEYAQETNFGKNSKEEYGFKHELEAEVM